MILFKDHSLPKNDEKSPYRLQAIQFPNSPEKHTIVVSGSSLEEKIQDTTSDGHN